MYIYLCGIFLCQYSGVRSGGGSLSESEGVKSQHHFQGALLHCQQYSLQLERLLSVHLCMFAIMCTHIYNVYKPLGLNRHMDAPGKLTKSSVLQINMLLVFIIFYFHVEGWQLCSRKGGKAANWVGVISLFPFSQTSLPYSHIVLGKANNPVVNSAHFLEGSFLMMLNWYLVPSSVLYSHALINYQRIP